MKELSFRGAEERDSSLLLEWRNDPKTREMSLDQGVVSLQAHSHWFARKLASSSCQILIAEYKDQAIGMLRFDIADSGVEAEVSINLAPAFRGQGLSKTLLVGGIDWFLEANVDVDMLLSTMRVENRASMKIFEYAGFVLTDVWDSCRFLRCSRSDFGARAG